MIASTARLVPDVVIPLRDGVGTSAELWLAPGDEPRPALLVRTPYPKELEVVPPLLDVRAITAAGFSLVVQDVRGTGGSGGEFEPFVAEGPDGADTIAWIASQPWCDGRVAMAGASYCGYVQWLAAAQRPPELLAIAPALAADQAGEGWSFTGGRREHGFLTTWIAATLMAPDDLWLDDMARAPRDVAGLATGAPWSIPWFAEDAASPYWEERSPQAGAVEVPAFMLGGWYDVFLAGTLRAFARGRHPWDRLVVGPWGHDGRLSHLVGEADLGVAGAGAGACERMLEFLDAVTDGREPDGPRVLAYLLGRREWLGFDAWPPPDAREVEMALAGAGEFAVEPDDLPVLQGGRGLLVSVPGGGWGVADQRAVAARGDTVVLEAVVDADRPVVLAGPLAVTMPVAAAGGAARDWVVVLCEVDADGAMRNLCEGIARAPAGDSEVTVELGDAFVELSPGTQLRAIVAGGWFPRWDAVGEPGIQRVLPGARLSATVLPDRREAAS